jgi:hypothetical protein
MSRCSDGKQRRRCPHPAKVSRQRRSDDDNNTVAPVPFPALPQPRTRATSASAPALRAALSSLDEQLAALLAERASLQASLEHTARLHAPVQRLPSELLAAIFAISTSGEEDNELVLSTLMLVCRHWTSVVRDTPVLWSRISITGPSLSRAQLRLERSKSVPLDVSVVFDPKRTDDDVTDATVVRALDLLAPSIGQWRSFRLSVPTRAQAHAALARCASWPAPLLLSLSVRIINRLYDDFDDYPSLDAPSRPAPLPIFAGNLPRLVDCTLHSLDSPTAFIRLSGLRRLDLGGYWDESAPSVYLLLDTLRASPSLEELVLRNMSDVDPAESLAFAHEPHAGPRFPQHVIPLPRLKKISLCNAGSGRAAALFSQIAFPAVQTVEFAYMNDIKPLLEHLARQSITSLPLRRLSIEYCSISEENVLIDLLGRVPELSALELVDVEDASSALLKVGFAPRSS